MKFRRNNVNLQKTDVDFAIVDTLIAATYLTLTRLLASYGQYMKYWRSLKGGPENLTLFHDQVYLPYIQNVIENLHDRFPDNPVLEALSLLGPDFWGNDPSEHDWIHQTKLQVMKYFDY